jgi:glyceraldehyde 3-phosphate dehydrogenase
MAKVAINGLGRIGRAALKIALDTPELELVAANDIASPENLAYLLKYDTVYGRYEQLVASGEDSLIIAGKKYRLFREKDPARLPWSKLGIDIVLECTGVFTRREDLAKHIQAGAKNVILSAPAKSNDIVTVVHGVNRPNGTANIIACASCTTNCITPIVEIMGRRIGVKKAIMTTIHAYTASQALVDGPSTHMRRGRAGAANFVPTSTGAAIATTRALPQFAGLFDGVAVRGPVPIGSLADIVFLTTRPTTVDEVNRIFKVEADGERYRGILGVTEEPIVSSDVIKDPRASIIDLGMTRVVDGDLVKVMSWYDNERAIPARWFGKRYR